MFVLDPDEAVRDSLSVALTAEGYRTRTFLSAEAFLQDGPPRDYGCMVVDVDLPAIGALELVWMLEAMSVRLPAILTTGRLMWRGPVWTSGRLLQKPFGPGELIPIIQAVLTGG